MKIEKVLNNNIISSLDDKGRELVLMGKGLGFGRKAGEEVDESKVEKIFRLDSNTESKHFQEIIENMPIEHLRLTTEIIKYAHEIITTKLCRSIYVTLSDHINFAIDRFHKNQNMSNQLKTEIKKFYPLEYQIGLKSLEMIKSELGIELPEDEAASIAMHFVNAELDNTNMNQTMMITKMIQNCMNIVKYHFKIKLDEESEYYSRFVTHLKYLTYRLFTGTGYETHGEEDEELFEMITRKYADEYKCAKRIALFVDKELHFILPDEELMYLTIHIRKITYKKPT